MFRILAGLAAALIAALSCGCVHSVHGIASEEALAYQEGLKGSWLPAEATSRWEFTSEDSRSYRLNFYDDKGNAGPFHAAVVQLDGTLYLDIVPDMDGQFEGETTNAFWLFHLRPVHNFMKLELEADVLKLSLIDPDKFGKYLQSNPGAVRHESGEDMGPLLTAATPELQGFIAGLKDIEGIWGEPLVLARKT